MSKLSATDEKLFWILEAPFVLQGGSELKNRSYAISEIQFTHSNLSATLTTKY